jgi:N4-gp56 family major capsid protein
MAIQNFPTALQPIIQQGFLEREFQDQIESLIGFRNIARREQFPNKIGETVTKTRPGLKAPVTTPITPSANTNLDNGLTPSTWTVEQYTLSIAMYGDSIDLNTVTNRVGIVEQFLQNAKTNGVQAAQSLDRLARNALFNAYMGGNTRVRVTLGAPAVTFSVDDIRGFQYVFVNGVLTAVSGGNTMQVTVGSNVYTLTGATADGGNVSTAPGGISGTLTFSGNVTVADATALNTVTAYNSGTGVAPFILRPNGRGNTSAIVGTDLLTMGNVLDGVAYLRRNGVPTVNGMYNLYLDPVSARQFFADPDFKQLFQGATTAAKEFRMGRVVELVDVRVIPTTEAFVQTLGTVTVRRPILVGDEALVEGDFEGMGKTDTPDDNAIIDMVDGIVQVTREPLDRLQQIIAQSWYWIGGFTAPTDQTVNTNIVPTASASYYKRGLVIEHAG